MAVTDDRKFTKAQVYTILENAKGKTLGEVDKSHQFARTEKSKKITGIAGDVIEQSVLDMLEIATKSATLKSTVYLLS